MPVIRRAVPADAGEVLTLQRAAWLSEGRRHNTFDIPPLTETLEQIRSAIASWTALVAVDGHRIVGSVRALAGGDPHYPDAWWIGRLGVVPDRQGEGIGAMLLDAAEAAAPAGATQAALTTGPRSDANIAFYQHRGYRHVDAPDGHPYSFLAHLVKSFG